MFVVYHKKQHWNKINYLAPIIFRSYWYAKPQSIEQIEHNRVHVQISPSLSVVCVVRSLDSIRRIDPNDRNWKSKKKGEKFIQHLSLHQIYLFRTWFCLHFILNLLHFLSCMHTHTHKAKRTIKFKVNSEHAVLMHCYCHAAFSTAAHFLCVCVCLLKFSRRASLWLNSK